MAEGRYRRVFTRIWRHAKFLALDDAHRVLTLYLLTGPQTNRCGLYRFSIGEAAEDLETSPETLRERLIGVLRTFGWRFDDKARVVWIRSWWRFNKPENANVLKGALADLDELPETHLLQLFSNHTGTLPSTLVETFRERMAKPSPIQEQEQEQDQSTPLVSTDQKLEERAEPARPAVSDGAIQTELRLRSRSVKASRSPVTNAVHTYVHDFVRSWEAIREQQYGRPNGRHYKAGKELLRDIPDAERRAKITSAFIRTKAAAFPYNSDRTLPELARHWRLVEQQLVEAGHLQPSAPSAGGRDAA